MKRLLVLLLCLFLCSCSSSENRIVDFFAQSDISFELNGILYNYNNDSDTFTVLSGSFEGMKVNLTSETAETSYDEFLLSTKANTFSGLKTFKRLYEAFAYNKSGVGITDDGTYFLLVDTDRFLVYYNMDLKEIDCIVAETKAGVYKYIFKSSEEEN